MRAAELPFTTEHTFPFLMTKPRWPVPSLCVVTVRWKGLEGEDSVGGPGTWLGAYLNPRASFSPVADNHDNLLG